MTRSFALTDPRAASAAPASYYYPTRLERPDARIDQPPPASDPPEPRSAGFLLPERRTTMLQVPIAKDQPAGAGRTMSSRNAGKPSPPKTMRSGTCCSRDRSSCSERA